MHLATAPADRLQHPRPDGVTLRRRRRHSRPRVLAGLHLLLCRHGHRIPAHLCAQNRQRRAGLLLPAAQRPVGGRHVWRCHVVCADVDAVLWAV